MDPFPCTRAIALLTLLACAPLWGCGRRFESAHVGALTASAERAIVPPLGSTVIDVSGGTGQVTLVQRPGDAQSGPDARVDGAARTYTAGRLGNVTDVVRVRDAAGTERQVHIAVGPALAITPGEVTVGPNGQALFAVSGGQPPYCFTVMGDAYCPLLSGAPACSSAGPGGCAIEQPGDGGARDSCIDGAGRFTAGGCGPTTQLVQVTDQNGATATARVEVGASLRVVASRTQVAPGESVQLLPSGGVPPYTFALAPGGNQSFGQVDLTGRYTAGPNSDESDTLVVTDFHGASTRVAIDVGDPSTPLPSRDAYDLYHGDLNGDGLQDLVAVSSSRGNSTIAISYGSPLGGVSPAVFFTVGDQVLSVLVADLDGDGNDDLVLNTEPFNVASTGVVALQLLRGQRGGGLVFTPPYVFPNSGSDPSYGWTAVLDFRPVGGPSVVGAVGGPAFTSGSHALLLLGAPDGGLQPLASLPIGMGTSAVGPDTLSTRRRTADGAPEALVLRYLDPSSGFGPECPNLAVAGAAVERLTLGLTDGGFQVVASPTACLELPDEPNVFRSNVLDLNGDDCADLYFAGYDWRLDQTFVDVLRSSTDGGWLAPERQTFPTYLFDTVASTLRGDELDLAGTGDGVRLIEGDGGMVVFERAFPPGTSALTSGDFDADHLTDFAIVTPAPALTLLAGDIGGETRTGRSFHLPQRGWLMATADADRDGRVALLVGSAGTRLFSGAGGRISMEAVQAAVEVAHGSRGRLVVGWTGPDGGGFVGTATFDDGGAEGQPLAGPPLVALFPSGADAAQDGQLLGFGYDLSGAVVPQALEVVDDGGLVLGQSGPGLPGFYAIPVEVSGGPHADLAVLDLASGGSGTSFALYPATSAGWSTVPSVQLDDTASLGGFPVVRMASFALHPGGRRDQMLMLQYFSGGAGCTGTTIWQTYAIVQGALVATGSAGPIESACAFPHLHVESADFDHDGNTDLLLSDSTHLSVLLGDGMGNFTSWPVRIGTPAGAIAVGDFDGDGWSDIAWSRTDLPLLQIALNAHDGGFH